MTIKERLEEVLSTTAHLISIELSRLADMDPIDGGELFYTPRHKSII